MESPAGAEARRAANAAIYRNVEGGPATPPAPSGGAEAAAAQLERVAAAARRGFSGGGGSGYHAGKAPREVGRQGHVAFSRDGGGGGDENPTEAAGPGPVLWERPRSASTGLSSPPPL